MATYPIGSSRTYTTIQSAVTAAGAAQDYDAQLPVDPGTYTGDFTLATRIPGLWAMPVHIYAADPANRPVIVPGTGGYNVTGDVQHADAGTRVPVFRNLIWSGGSNTTGIVNGSGGTPMHFIGCDFMNMTKVIFRFANAGVSHARRWEIRQCRFDGCTGGEVVSAGLAGYGLVEGCRFRHVSGSYSMVLCSTSSNWLAYNNSVSSTASGGYLFQVSEAKNNAVHVVSGSPLKLFVTTGTFDYNVFNWAGANSGTNGGHNNPVDVPGFANPTTGDFSISAGSPCYNYGTALADVTTDYLGTSRPQGSILDVGAFELIATTTVSSITVLGPTSVKLDLAASMASDATWATAGNFTVTSGTGAAVTVSSAAASGNPGTYITLTTSEHTNAATYNVAWSGLTGITSGNSNYTGQGTAPTLTSATFTGASTVRVVFSESMANNAALTTPANYTITPLALAPFVPTAVTRINATTVDLTVNRSLGADTATLSVTGPTDLAANPCSGATRALAIWETSVASATATTSSGASYLRLTFAAPVYYDAATWIGARVTTAPALGVTYYATVGSPAAAVDFVTSDQVDGASYGVTASGLSGVAYSTASFTGAGVARTSGAMSGPVFGAAFGSSGSGGSIDGLLAWDIMPRGVGSELSWERLVFTSLFTDGRIDAGATPPDGTTDRRGWWGDSYTEGTPAASRLWLISGSSGPTARAIEDAIRGALAWTIADGLADSIEVTVLLEDGRADSTINIIAQGQAVTVRVPALWSDYAG